MPVDQLLYTWADRGLSGYGMWQVVAATPDLIKEGRQRQLALRLCRYRYRGSSQSAPVSIGWIDSGGLRFAFRRAFLPDAQEGHPGNFAAHILVGSPQELMPELLLADPNSPSWWQARPEEVEPGVLGSFDPVLLAGGGYEPSPIANDVLAVLLSGAKRNVFVEDWRALANAVGLIAQAIPEIFERSSFSTFEGSETAPWFRTCGVDVDGEKDSRRNVTTHARAASSWTLQHSGTSAARTLYSHCVAREDGEQRFVDQAGTLQLLSEPGGIRDEHILHVLNSKIAAHDVLQIAGVRARVVERLRDGRSDFWNAVRLSAASLGDRLCHDLGIELGAQPDGAAVADQSSNASCVILDGLAKGLLDGLELLSCSEAAEAVSNWPAVLLSAALLRQDGTERAPKLLSNEVGRRNIRQELMNKNLPTSVRENVLEALLLHHHDVSGHVALSLPRGVLQAVRSEPNCAVPLVESMNADDGLELLRQMSRLGLRLDDRLASTFGVVFKRLDERHVPAAAAELLMPSTQRIDHPEWSAIVDRVLEVCAVEEINLPTTDHTEMILRLSRLGCAPDYWRGVAGTSARPRLAPVGKVETPAELTALYWTFSHFVAMSDCSAVAFEDACRAVDEKTFEAPESILLLAGKAVLRSQLRLRARPSMVWLQLLAKRLDNGELRLPHSRALPSSSKRTSSTEQRIDDIAQQTIGWLATNRRAEFEHLDTYFETRVGDKAQRWWRHQRVSAAPRMRSSATRDIRA